MADSTQLADSTQSDSTMQIDSTTECLCGRTPKSMTMYIKNDFILCSLRCMQKYFSDVPTIPSSFTPNKETHVVCKCGVIYPESLKFTVYGKQCCSPECIKVIREEVETTSKVKRPTIFNNRPDAGGGFAF